MMRSSRAFVSLGAAALLLASAAAWAHDNHNQDDNEEDEFPLAQAPAAVQETMRRVAGPAVPTELDKSTENGVVVYQGEYRVPGGENSIKVAENGELLEVKKEMAANQLPAAVRNAVDKSIAGATIKKAGSVYLKGATSPSYYELKVAAGARKKHIKVRPSGEIVS